ncbi:RodZ domain-containing protein [Psychromonas algarum]|uniref:RodZ domain-containing protein n=1 Tax=Psychromonas algarum TaxID=2555643 RepID=UPI0014199D49|nr:RodZ domain-containing protein [Psychromonas sp. RZ22]
MSDQIKDKNEQQIPLEQALKDGRLAAQLSVEDIALRLNLKKTVIRDIEDSLDTVIAEAAYPKVYLRGYLVNYSKEIGLDDLESFPQYQQLLGPEKSATGLKNPHIMTYDEKSYNKSLIILLLLFVAMVVGVTVFWKTSPDSTKASAGSASKTDNVEMRLPETASQDVETSTLDIQQQAQPGVQIEKNNALSSAQTTQQNVDNNGLEALSSTSEQSVEITDSPEKTVLTEQTLTLKFKDECWTEIFDATGKRLAFGLYTKGEQLKLAGTPPFNLKLGNPIAADVFYQDKLYKKSFRAGRTANFKLPE